MGMLSTFSNGLPLSTSDFTWRGDGKDFPAQCYILGQWLPKTAGFDAVFAPRCTNVGHVIECHLFWRLAFFYIQNRPKSQICHLYANASNRATSLEVGRYIEVVMEKLCRTFYAKIVNH